MHLAKWTAAEKKIARRAFDAALQREFAALIQELKAQAAVLSTPDQVWDMHHELSAKLREINQKYDYRYSMLDLIFARLLNEQWIDDHDLEGLDPDKISAIRQIAGR